MNEPLTNKNAEASRSADELERQQFRELAYRLLYSTDLQEQSRLKDELVRRVVRRKRSRMAAAHGEVPGNRGR